MSVYAFVAFDEHQLFKLLLRESRPLGAKYLASCAEYRHAGAEETGTNSNAFAVRATCGKSEACHFHQARDHRHTPVLWF